MTRLKFVVWNNDKEFSFFKSEFIRMGTKYAWNYFHFAQEHAPGTGRPHIDGYYETPGERRLTKELSKFNKKFGTGFGQLVIAKGTAGENIDYSEKEEGTYYVQGEPAPHPPGSGARTDIKDKCESLMKGETTVDEIMLDDPEFYHKYGRTLHRVEDLALRKRFRTTMTKGLWIWGPTAVGKSHKAFDGFDPETHYLWKLDDNGWQDGYTGQGIVIINEFRGTIPYQTILDMVDKWPFTVKRRGREPAPFLADRVIITSPLPPEEVYHRSNEKDSLTQFFRRFEVEHMTERMEIDDFMDSEV